MANKLRIKNGDTVIADSLDLDSAYTKTLALNGKYCNNNIIFESYSTGSEPVALIPTMSSSTCSVCTVSGNGSVIRGEPYQAFDGDTSTYFNTFIRGTRSYDASTATSSYLQVVFNSTVTVTSIYFYSTTWAEYDYATDPRYIEIFTSTDGSTWTSAGKAGFSYVSSPVKASDSEIGGTTVTLSSPITSKYFRFRYDANSTYGDTYPSRTYVMIHSLQLYGYNS